MRVLIVALLLNGLLVSAAHAAPAGATVAVEQAATISPKEKVDFTHSAVVEIEEAIKQVEKLLEQAEKDKNQEQIDCLTRKLTPMRALMDVARSSDNAMQTAMSVNDSVHADTEFRKVAVALEKVREFLQEALTCVGDTTGEKANSVSSLNKTAEDLADESDLPDDASVEFPLANPSPY